MPTTANGKIDKARLEALLTQDGNDSPAARTQPRDLVEFRLSQLWREVLGVEKIGLHDDFFRLGGHSLLCVRLAGMILDEFGQRVPLSAFLTCRTVEQFAAYLRAEGRQQNSILVPIQPHGAGAPLFLLPGAGGSAVYFFELARHLKSARPIWGIQASGLDSGEFMAGRIEEMASQYIDAIQREVRPEGSYRLAGHSLGGLVAFEMARQLLRQGAEIAFLGVIDNPAPSQPAAEYEGWDRERWLRHIAIRLEKLYRVELGVSQGGLTEDDLIGRMLEAGLLPPETHLAYFRHFIDVYRSNAMAAARYRPSCDPLPVALTLFRAQERDEQLNNSGESDADENLGWSAFISPPIDLVRVPGTHITMMTEPHVRVLGQALQERLDALPVAEMAKAVD
jgi:thioesterase domain-containing protein/acyl carrier protein